MEDQKINEKFNDLSAAVQESIVMTNTRVYAMEQKFARCEQILEQLFQEELAKRSGKPDKKADNYTTNLLDRFRMRLIHEMAEKNMNNACQRADGGWIGGGDAPM